MTPEEALIKLTKKFKIFTLLLVLTFISTAPTIFSSFFSLKLLDFIPIKYSAIVFFGMGASFILSIPFIISFRKLRIAIKTSAYNFEKRSSYHYLVIAILSIPILSTVSTFGFSSTSVFGSGVFFTDAVSFGALLFFILFVISFSIKIRAIKQTGSFLNKKLAYYYLISSTFFPAIIIVILSELYLITLVFLASSALN